MKYSKPKLRGLGGSAGACLDGSSATAARSGPVECVNGPLADGICTTGGDATTAGCAFGDLNTELCGLGHAADYPSACEGGSSDFAPSCSQGSSPA